jgi:tape measure domain-containing protein
VANNIGSLAVQITGNSTGLTKALHAAESGVKHSMGKIAAIATGVGAGLFAGFSIGSFVLDSIKIASEMEDVAASFKTMTGSATEGETLFRDIEDASDAMRMNVKDTAEAAKGLFSAGIGSDQIVPTLKLMGDMAMGDAEKLKTLSQAYAKVVDDGIVSSRTMRAFAGAGVFLGDEIAKGMGLNKGEFQEALKEGKVGLRDLQKAMLAVTGEGGKMFGAAEERAKTFAGKIDALQNMWEDFKWDFGGMLIDELGLKGLVDALTSGLGMGRKNLDEFRPILREIKNIAKEIGRALFSAFANATIAASELANVIATISGDKTASGEHGPTAMMYQGLRKQVGKLVFGGGQKRDSDIIDTGKLAAQFTKLGDMLDGVVGNGSRIGGASGIGRGDALRQMGEEARKAGEAFKLAAIAATEADKQFMKGVMERAFPVNTMKNELKEIRDRANRGAFNVKGGGIAADQAQADIFDKFVKDFSSAVQLSSVALQDSADAVSAISNHRMGGRQDPQARAAAALDQLVAMEKENQRINAAKAAAVNNWIIKNGPLP